MGSVSSETESVKPTTLWMSLWVQVGRKDEFTVDDPRRRVPGQEPEPISSPSPYPQCLVWAAETWPLLTFLHGPDSSSSLRSRAVLAASLFSFAEIKMEMERWDPKIAPQPHCTPSPACQGAHRLLHVPTNMLQEGGRVAALEPWGLGISIASAETLEHHLRRCLTGFLPKSLLTSEQQDKTLNQAHLCPRIGPAQGPEKAQTSPKRAHLFLNIYRSSGIHQFQHRKFWAHPCPWLQGCEQELQRFSMRSDHGSFWGAREGTCVSKWGLSRQRQVLGVSVRLCGQRRPWCLFMARSVSLVAPGTSQPYTDFPPLHVPGSWLYSHPEKPCLSWCAVWLSEPIGTETGKLAWRLGRNIARKQGFFFLSKSGGNRLGHFQVICVIGA